MESAFDAFWRATNSMVECQLAVVTASMTVGLEFWDLWHVSRGLRAIEAIKESASGGHSVIYLKKYA